MICVDSLISLLKWYRCWKCKITWSKINWTIEVLITSSADALIRVSLNKFVCEIAKGQIISKGLLVLLNPPKKWTNEFVFTGKSLSEALILALTLYDDRLLIELPVEYLKIPSSSLVLLLISNFTNELRLYQFLQTCSPPHF